MLHSSCSCLHPPSIPGADVIAFAANEVHNFSFPAWPLSVPPVAVSGINFCNTSLALQHHGADDIVYVDTWLPLDNWNGRYVAIGGGGLAAGFDILGLPVPVSQGFVASSTDGGLTLNNTVEAGGGSWALNSDGSQNHDLITNFAHRSIHDMAVVAKDLTRQFYKTTNFRSYFLGCSNGGRQGYVAASKYPEDFDGIVANAPALSWFRLAPSLFWPDVVMQSANKVIPSCVFDAYVKAVVEKCDPLDGATDGLLSDQALLRCSLDTSTLVNTTIACQDQCLGMDPSTGVNITVPCGDNKPYTITSTDADLVSKMLEGPRSPSGEFLWYGIAPGATFSALALTVLEDDILVPAPFIAAAGYMKYLALANAGYDVSTMTYPDYFLGFNNSVNLLAPAFDTDPLNLTAFREKGGKLLTWAGMADEYINPQGVVDFRDALDESNGGADVTDEFYRLFLAPGAGHCLGGVGPLPEDPVTALVSWVERGVAPETLHASTLTSEGIEMTRDLCTYPKKLVYLGGDVNLAASFKCQ
ncbi:feruloyl esterase [Thozetella sp. PMI_491]|nr:feruloyl esterase [Thozetella sp. PMI_491]